jgi:hypothetical protein
MARFLTVTFISGRSIAKCVIERTCIIRYRLPFKPDPIRDGPAYPEAPARTDLLRFNTISPRDSWIIGYLFMANQAKEGLQKVGSEHRVGLPPKQRSILLGPVEAYGGQDGYP